MAANLISEDAVAINGLHLRVVNLITEKYRDMIRSTREAVIEALIDAINELDQALRRPAVRVHAYPNLSIPIVDEDSSLNSILRRLQHQITVACIMADMMQIGAAANADEANALADVKQALRSLFENISPVSSLNASATDSN